MTYVPKCTRNVPILAVFTRPGVIKLTNFTRGQVIKNDKVLDHLDGEKMVFWHGFEVKKGCR